MLLIVPEVSDTSGALRLMQSFSGLSSGVLALIVNKRSLWRP